MLKKGLLSGLILILSCLSAFAADETVITTYYPSPYGYYKELKVNRSVTYVPVTSLPGDGKEGELVFFNDDKKFYYYDGTQWIPLGEKQVLTVTSASGSFVTTETTKVSLCGFSSGKLRKGYWTYNFPQPVNIVAIEVSGDTWVSVGGGQGVSWFIQVSNNSLLPTIMIRESFWDPCSSCGSPVGGVIRYDKIGIGRSILASSYQGITSLKVEWDMAVSFETWQTCSSYFNPGLVIVYYTLA